MEIAIVGGVLAFMVFTAWLVIKVNHYSIVKYGHQPIGIASTFLAMPPYIMIAAGYIFEYSSPYNLEVAFAFAGLSAIGLWIWVAKKSSVMIGLISTILLLIVGLPALIFLLTWGE